MLLLRLHSMVTDRLDIPARARRSSTSSDRADIRELYLAADVLVTDYSSAMFDFAITGKPLVFFTYDLDHYRDELRGFYFDLAEVAPGPLVATSEELIAAIADLDAVAAEHRRRGTPRSGRPSAALEDGHATERVLDLLFPPGGTTAGRHHDERG